MKRLYLILTLMMLIGLTGCQTGKWRLRGAKCRPGMSMPTYAQPAPAPDASCNPDCGPAEYAAPGYIQSSGYVPGGSMMSGGVVVDEFPTAPIDDQTQVLQRPYVTSPTAESVGDGDVVAVPGPELGPLPNG